MFTQTFNLFEEIKRETQKLSVSKHRETIIAWANGEQIQYYDGETWVDTDHPSWAPQVEYRVKPKINYVSRAFRNFTYECDGTIRIGVIDKEEEHLLDKSSFLEWLGDWQTVEILTKV
jgi:hypothetical protein